MSEIDLLRESLRKVQQERERYRHETACLRTENAKLQNDIDILFTRLSDLDGPQVRIAASSVAEPHQVADSSDKGTMTTPNLAHTHRSDDPDVREASMPEDGRVQPTKLEQSPLVQYVALKVEKLEDDAIELFGEVERGMSPKSLKRPLSPSVREASCDAKKKRVDRRGAGVAGSNTAREKLREKPDARSPSPAAASLSDEQPEEPAIRDFQHSTVNNGQTSRVVAGPLKEPRSYYFYDRIPAQCLTLPLQKIKSYLQQASCAPFPTVSPIIVSREFLANHTYANRGGSVAKLRFSPCGTFRHILVSSCSPYFPISFGAPGLFISCLKDLLDGSRQWSCMSLHPRLTSRRVMYMGEYLLKFVGTMSVEEYENQEQQAKIKNAALMVTSRNYKQRVSHSKASFDKVCAEAAQMFTTGEEKINIFLMEFVEYDVGFAHWLLEKYQGQKRSRPSAVKHSDRRTSVKRSKEKFPVHIRGMWLFK